MYEGHFFTMVEMHSHILYGVDDGPKDASTMHRLLKQAADIGVDHVICTSHITPGYTKFPQDEYLAHLQEAKDWCQKNAPKLQLHIGSEILYTESTCRLLDEGFVPSLDQTMFVLVEFMPESSLNEIRHALEDLGAHGYEVVIAHVERYVHLHSIATLKALKEECGCYYQMNSRTVYNTKDHFLNRLHTEKLLKSDLIDFVSSDAHSPDHRPMSLDKAYAYLKDKFGPDKATALCGGNISRLLQLDE